MKVFIFYLYLCPNYMRPEKQIGFSNINDSLIVIRITTSDNQRKAIIDLLIGVTVPSQDVVHCH
ncbi:hypothetical protein BFAG_01090 [Bacteroides fragilis 3_1_12]|uniref:Transposase n=1 Tax=Bacteroides fragilis 3_1_12 TaxID=457424 RepID=A0ABN0BHK2_BACFG|nr:hypothetical protein BFAG_01090 [Bacteroides fragilis 3_1_12]